MSYMAAVRSAATALSYSARSASRNSGSASVRSRRSSSRSRACAWRSFSSRAPSSGPPPPASPQPSPSQPYLTTPVADPAITADALISRQTPQGPPPHPASPNTPASGRSVHIELFAECDPAFTLLTRLIAQGGGSGTVERGEVGPRQPRVTTAAPKGDSGLWRRRNDASARPQWGRSPWRHPPAVACASARSVDMYLLTDTVTDHGSRRLPERTPCSRRRWGSSRRPWP